MQGTLKADAEDAGPNLPGLALTEDDAFFLMRLLEHLETESERRRLIEIVEQIAKYSSH
jgi:hypothetical protein